MSKHCTKRRMLKSITKKHLTLDFPPSTTDHSVSNTIGIQRTLTASREEGPLGCIVIKKVRFSSPNLVMGFVNHQIW